MPALAMMALVKIVLVKVVLVKIVPVKIRGELKTFCTAKQIRPYGAIQESERENPNSA